MPKPKTKDLARKGADTGVQRVKMQMRDASGRDVSPESYGGETIEDSAQYVAGRTADGIREMGSFIKDKAMEQIKERMERVRQREDGPNAQEPGGNHAAPQELQSGRSYTDPRTDPHTGRHDRPVEAAPDSHDGRTPRQRPEGGERIKTRDTYIRAQGEMAFPKEVQKGPVQADRAAPHAQGKAPAKSLDTAKHRPSAYADRSGHTVRHMERTASNMVRQTGKRSIKTAEKGAVKTFRKGAVKTAKRGAVKTSRTAIKTAEKSVKLTERAAHVTAKTAQTAVRGAQATARAAQAAAKAAVAGAKAAAKAAAALIKALIAAVKGLVAAIAAGGWVAVVIILAIALVAVILYACFGVFASNETEDGSHRMTEAILEIDADFRAGIDAEIARLSTGDYDEISVRYAGDIDGDSDYIINWNDVIAVYAVRVTMDEENPMDVLEVTPEKIEKLRETFLDMNTVEYDTEIIETEGAGAQVGDEDEEEAEPYRKLVITITVNSMDHLAGADFYSFTDDKREALAAMMEPQMLPMYAELVGVDLLGGFEGSITDIVSGLPVGEKGTEIVTAALTRLGHPYSQEKRGEGNYVDCSYLVRWAYEQAGISLPGTSVAQAQYCVNNGLNIGQSELAPGDLVFWSKTTCDCGRYAEIHHVGIYIGENRVIEASSAKGRVVIQELWGLGGGKWQVHLFTRIS